jgi:hypothetical protein
MLRHCSHKGATEGDGFLQAGLKRQHVPVVEAKTRESTVRESVRDPGQRAGRLQFQRTKNLARTAGLI